MFDENREKVELPSGLIPLDIFVHSLDRELLTDRLEGSNRTIYRGYNDISRPIEIKFGLLSNDTKDYRLLRDAMYSLFYRYPRFYVAEKYQPGKLYHVSVSTSFIPDRLTQTMAEARASLEIVGVPYAESMGTTADIEAEGISSDDEIWGYGMGLIAEDLIYTHTAISFSTFSIYNAGNVAIHPFEQDLKITISDVSENGNTMGLRNITTGDLFQINEALGKADVVVMDGPKITKNGLQYLRQTNKEFITLVPGWNDFIVEGAYSAKVEFDFRFYYL
ncbi:phage tail family protein [Halobacillus karajensis]|uniref:phage tail family protein n=1 Tax=Halobacillus karajensis TaxID=195088 RepID=UPI0021CCDE4E|nr:phage tail family protein [Halobacillus karajensis]